MSEVWTKLEAVKDEQTFVEFLHALLEDRVDPKDRSEWQNDTIESFLEAAARWAGDSIEANDKFYKMPDNPWKRAADILYCGKIYE